MPPKFRDFANTIVRSRKLKTIKSSKSGSNDYVCLRIWSNGIQYYKCLNIETYNTPESINHIERAGYEQIRTGHAPVDWSCIQMPNPNYFHD